MVDSLKLNRYVVYHTYSTGLWNVPRDCDAIAKRLVSARLARAAMSSNLRAFASHKGRVETCEAAIEIDPDSLNTFVHFPIKADRFSANSLVEIGRYAIEQRRMFDETFLRRTGFVKAWLEPFVATSRSVRATLYPQLTLTSDGVLLLSHTVFSAGQIGVSEFISDILNLPLQLLDELNIPTNVMKLSAAQTALEFAKTPFSRWAALTTLPETRNAIDAVAQVQDDPEFDQKLSTIPLSETSGESQLNFEAMNSHIFAATCSAINHYDKEAGEIFARGSRPRCRQADWWFGRPCVCLLDLEPDSHSATELLNRHSPDFIKILSRSASVSPTLARTPIESIRSHDDFVSIPGAALDLFAHCTKARTPDGEGDKNAGADTVPSLIKSEFISYSRARLKMLTDLATPGFWIRKSASTVSVRKITFEMQLYAAPHFGELRDLFAKMRLHVGWDQLIDAFEKFLNAKRDIDADAAAERRRAMDLCLLWVFGLVGTTSAVDILSLPISNFLRVDSTSDFKLAIWLIVAVAVSAIVLITLYTGRIGLANVKRYSPVTTRIFAFGMRYLIVKCCKSALAIYRRLSR